MANAIPDPELPLGPATVPTKALRPNPHNPRMLFDPLPLKTLEESIQKVGILVPLTVYRGKGSDHFTILDGQRRWICAERLGLPSVPINQVREPSVAGNIVTMFQIHKLRKDWELMPTALKLGVLIEELKERSDPKLADLTGLDVAVVNRCKKLLWYPKKYQQMMLFTNPSDRIKADFFIELYPILTDRLVVTLDWYNRDVIIDRYLHKYQNRLSGFKSITDFRKIKQAISVARAAGHEAEIGQRLRELTFNDDVSLAILEIETANVHRQAERLARTVAKVKDEVRTLESRLFLGEDELWNELESLVATIRRKLQEAGRRTV